MKNHQKKSITAILAKPWWQIGQENTINYKIMKSIIRTSYILPKNFRKNIFSFFDEVFFLISRLFSILNQIPLTAYIFTGKEKNSKEKIKIMYISNTTFDPYISKLIFLDQPKMENKFKINIINYKKKIKKLNSKIDGILLKNDRFYSGYFEKQGFTSIPEWISTKLYITESWDNYKKNLSKSVKEDLRKIKKNKFTYEISHEKDKIKMFYYKMYLPYITKKYRKIESCAHFYAIKHLFETGNEILFIKQNDEYIFGGVFLKKKNKIYASYAGVMQGKYDYIQKGAIAASYYYLIQHSIENNAKEIDLGSCRPFVNDGLFSYKKKWGAEIEKMGNECPQNYFFKVVNNKKSIKKFLSSNPAITMEKNHIH